MGIEEKTELMQLRAFKEYFDDLYGKGLKVANWHLNGDMEPFDSFYESAMHEYEKGYDKAFGTGIFGVTSGIICQQCNCKGAYGAGLSGAIAAKYPEVLKSFNADYDLNKGRQFGTYRIIPVDFTHTDKGVKELSIANIYSQNDYGNSAITRRKYTDTDKLVSAIKDICEHSDCNVYIPHSVDKKGKHSGIGCGLAGEKWENLYPRLQALNAPNLYLLDTFTGEIEKVQPAGKEQSKPHHKKGVDRER